MKFYFPKIFAAVLAILYVLPWMVSSASAHRVNVFAWVEGDTIYVEGKFAGGKKVNAGKIVVMDPRGVELLSGLTNAQGEFSFKVSKQTDLKIVLSAGQGHQGEWIIRADEINNLSSKAVPGTSTESVAQSIRKEAGSETTTDRRTVAPETAISPEELEAIIESVVDRKLKPITGMLAEMRQDGPSLRDIFAGIGYILGLVGIAAYVHSRKKKA